MEAVIVWPPVASVYFDGRDHLAAIGLSITAGSVLLAAPRIVLNNAVAGGLLFFGRQVVKRFTSQSLRTAAKAAGYAYVLGAATLSVLFVTARLCFCEEPGGAMLALLGVLALSVSALLTCALWAASILWEFSESVVISDEKRNFHRSRRRESRMIGCG